MTDDEIREALREFPYSSLRAIESRLQVSKSRLRRIFQEDGVDTGSRFIIRELKRRYGESIVPGTWLHTGDVVLGIAGDNRGRVARIVGFEYHDDLTRSVILVASRPAPGRTRAYRSKIHESTLRLRYCRTYTAEERVP